MKFWAGLDRLMRESVLVVDRPRGSTHLRYPDFVYPLDYGYLEGTVSGDGKGIDVWRGTMKDVKVQGVLVSLDLLKKDVEIKLISGCTDEEIRLVCSINSEGMQSSILVKREG